MKKKLYSFLAASFIGCIAMGAVAPTPAIAGPKIDFGDDGYLQLDVKFQGLADHTDFGSGVDGDKSRTDLNLRRARIVFTGMMDDTWGVKFQT